MTVLPCATEAERAAFIRAETGISPVPHVPEIRLHVAHEAIALWQKTEEELQEMGLPPPFWAFAWAGGQGLARYLLDHPAEVAGRRVLDFATGSGLVAIAAAMAGAGSVLAVDIDPFAVVASRLNAAENSVTIEAAQRDVIGLDEGWEVILAGDVCYEQAMAARVLDWLEGLRQRGARVLLGDPGRSYLPKQGLSELAAYEVPVVGALEDHAIKRTVVWTLAG
ncbi:methyltransferase [Rhabdaerophilum sp. SD176]|uniref:class I SAM-dependent methyltransferase n=1 Tax=Rhabdaerophilum sp. SD176 TaxID=2983548 RepID=UPI0024DF4B2F|nr:methyltransferase [Rhabdaerophilum sp. SD176]